MSSEKELRNLRIKKFEVKFRYYIFFGFLIIFNIFILPHSTTILTLIINVVLMFSIIREIVNWIRINKSINKIKKKIEDEQNRYDPFANFGKGTNFDKTFSDLWERILREQAKKQQQQQQNITLNSEKINNAYQLFKVSRNDSPEKIKKVYRELAIKWHPDKWSTDTLENQRIAERNFKKLQSAYDLIKKDKNIV